MVKIALIFYHIGSYFQKPSDTNTCHACSLYVTPMNMVKTIFLIQFIPSRFWLIPTKQMKVLFLLFFYVMHNFFEVEFIVDLSVCKHSLFTWNPSLGPCFSSPKLFYCFLLQPASLVLGMKIQNLTYILKLKFLLVWSSLIVWNCKAEKGKYLKELKINSLENHTLSGKYKLFKSVSL